MRRTSQAKKDRYQSNKMLMFRCLGGKCEECGFDNVKALQFDHIDHSKKTANLTAYLNRKDLSKAFDELHFCRLLCANCHAIATTDSGRLQMGKGWI